MNIEVTKNKVLIDNNYILNDKEYNVSLCKFSFSEEYTNDLVKKAVFIQGNHKIEILITNNQCNIPNEVLNKGQLEIHVYAYQVVEEELILRYSPTYATTYVRKGSYVENATNTEPITPTDKQQMEQMLNNIDIEANKINKITSIIITKKDGTHQIVNLEDGIGLDFIWQGTALGIKRETEESYQYTDLKGEKGEPGAIKISIVQTLPEVGLDDTIYLVPLEEPESQKNKYAEYIYINNDWELLGKIGIEVDLTGYVKNTDFATNVGASKAGVIKVGTYGTATVTASGQLYCASINYNTYNSQNENYFISKGTLENVITGKGLVSKTNYATSSVAGVLKIDSGLGIDVSNNGALVGVGKSYSTYNNAYSDLLIAKGTLENVFAGKGFNSTPKVIVITETDYNNLQSYEDNTEYHIIEG